MNQKERNASLERVIDDYSNILYKICFIILKNEQDTRDVLQETFLTYMTKSPKFHSEEHKKAWLIKVSQNKCREFLRFHKRHAGIPLDEVEESLEITNGMNYEDREKLLLMKKRLDLQNSRPNTMSIMYSLPKKWGGSQN